MYVCIWTDVCVYICMFICIYIYLHVCVFGCLYICMFMCICVQMPICMCMCTCMSVGGGLPTPAPFLCWVSILRLSSLCAVCSSSSVYSFELCLMGGAICLPSENPAGQGQVTPVCASKTTRPGTKQVLYDAFYFLFLKYVHFTKPQILPCLMIAICKMLLIKDFALNPS